MRHPQRDKGSRKLATKDLQQATRELFGEGEPERSRPDNNSRGNGSVWIAPGVLVPESWVSRLKEKEASG